MGVSLSPQLCPFSPGSSPPAPHTLWPPEALDFLILKDLEEEWGEEFGGALDFHVEEAAGVAGPDHAEVSHLHQQLGPEVRNVVFAVVDVVLERQQVRLLTLLNLVHTQQALSWEQKAHRVGKMLEIHDHRGALSRERERQ